MLAERVKEWTTQWKQEGLEAGRQQGRQEGRQEGRQVGRQEGRQEGLTALVDMARYKFGDHIANQLAENLANLDQNISLSEVGQWIIACESGEDLLAKF